MDPRDRIRNKRCKLCDLHKGAKHVCLMGDGPIPCKVMVVGEAPGAREDDQHRAFVGKAGKLLNSVLKEAGFRRSNVYITNVAKCRPPENRTPSKGEIRTCVDAYLYDEIEAVRPSYLLTLGNAALTGLLGKSGIKKHRGTVEVREFAEGLDTTVLATYHPAFILRNPFHMAELRADVQRFRRLIDGEDSEPATRTYLIDTRAKLDTLLRILSHAPVISYDVETTMEEWWSEEGAIATIAFTVRPGEAFVVPIHHQDTRFREPMEVMKKLKPFLEREDAKYLGHNGKFDQKWLASYGIFNDLTFDTMLAAHMINENRAKGLKPLSQVILGAHAYDAGVDVKSAMSENLGTLARYNGKDTDYTLRLYHRFKKELIDEPRTGRIFAKLMMPANRVLVKAERAGMWVDPQRIVERTTITEEEQERVYRKLMSYVPKKRYGNASEKKQPERINFNSPQQVAEWLFVDLELPVLDLTKTDAPSTNESVLLRLAQDHPAPKLMLKYREVTKRLNTYLYPWRDRDRDARSRIHTSYKLFGTVTGRLSSQGPNLQQVPRDPFMRSIFGSPPGWKFISADYSQVELRIAAMLAREEAMLRVFMDPGRDIHLETAQQLLGRLNIEKEERKLAKAVNFGFLYGMGSAKFVEYARDNYEIEVEGDEAEQYRLDFFQKWPALKPWHDRQRRLVQRYGRVQSPIGRVRHLPDIESDDRSVRGEAERQAINSPVQSFASDLMLIAMIHIDKQLNPRKGRIIGTVHDQILAEAKNGYVKEASEIIKSTMEDMGNVKRMFGVDMTVPIVADLEVSQHWAEA